MSPYVFPMFPMSSLCFSYAFSMLFLCPPYAFPMPLLCFSYSFPMLLLFLPCIRHSSSSRPAMLPRRFGLGSRRFHSGKRPLRSALRRAAFCRRKNGAERTGNGPIKHTQTETAMWVARDRFFFEKKIARQQTLTEKLFSPRWADCTHTAVYNSLYTVGIRGCTWAIVTAVQSSLTSVAYIASKANRSCINAYRRPGRAHARSAFPFAVVKPSSSCCCHPLGRRWPGCVAAGRVGIGRGAHAGGS